MAEDTTKLEKALSQGVQRARHGDEEVRYRSIDELLKAIGYLTARTKEAAGAARRFVIRARKGW